MLHILAAAWPSMRVRSDPPDQLHCDMYRLEELVSACLRLLFFIEVNNCNVRFRIVCEIVLLNPI